MSVFGPFQGVDKMSLAGECLLFGLEMGGEVPVKRAVSYLR